MRLLVTLLLACSGLTPDTAWAEGLPEQHLDVVESVYLEYCGGCHGNQGVSAPEIIPTIRGMSGQFLCTEEGRSYMVRLPNLALSPLDDEMLAALMNFVAFDMGGGDKSVYPLYSAEEVGALRKTPLITGSLLEYRKKIVDDLVTNCNGSNNLYEYGGLIK